MKLASSIVSVLVFACVIFGAPVYDAFHGNWPGAKFAGPKDAAAIRSGKAAKALEKSLESRSQLDELVRPKYNELAFLALGKTNKGVVVGPNDWLFPEMRLNALPATHKEDLARAVAAIGAITRHFEEKGTRVIFELVPRRTALYPEELPRPYRDTFEAPYDMVRDAMLAEGLDVPDLRPALMEGGELRYMRNDEHWKPEGALAAAKVIARALLPGFGDAGPPGPPVDVMWRQFPKKDFRGYQQRILKFTEGGYMDRRFTEDIAGIHAVGRKNENKRYDGSKEYRPILLVGTSYSRHPFFGASQFIGLFKVDIQDYSKDGYAGGFRMVEVFRRLLTERSAYPEVLIWEFPEDFPVREGAYFYEPLESIVSMIGGAPYEVQPLGAELRELKGVQISQEAPPMLRGISATRDSEIVFRLPEPVMGRPADQDSAVVCFDLNPSGGGPHLGFCEVSWGGGEPYREYGSKRSIIRRSNWLHPFPTTLTVPSSAPEGLMIDRVIIRPFTARTEIEFGRVELWMPKEEGPR